jgi:hypothetical protein
LRSFGYHADDIADIAAEKFGPQSHKVARLLAAAGYEPTTVERACAHTRECGPATRAALGKLPKWPADEFRLQVNAGLGDLKEMGALAWQMIVSANTPPQFFRLGNVPVWIETFSGLPEVVRLERDRMNHLLGQVAAWVKKNRSGEISPARPPRDLAADLLVDPHSPLPHLSRLVRTPVFAPDADGRPLLLDRPGFHEPSGVFVAPTVEVPRVVHHPTEREVRFARRLICDELLVDFPFVDEADRSGAVALLLHHFARGLIDGPTPLHLFTKPMPRVGATLLVNALSVPALGAGQLGSNGPPTNDAEWSRLLTALLSDLPPIVFFDNVSALTSPQLASAITTPLWNGREIRTSAVWKLPVTAAWVATGNNVTVSAEIAGRTVPIQLDAQMEDPSQRTKFRHPHLITWAEHNRPLLVWAALTLIQYWVDQGMPEGRLVMGGFERWAAIMSGILDTVGIPGLRKNWADWVESAGPIRRNRSAAVRAWDAEFGPKFVKASDLLPVVGQLLGVEPDEQRAMVTSLGRILASLDGQVIGGFEIQSRSIQGSNSYRLVPKEKGRTAGT